MIYFWFMVPASSYLTAVNAVKSGDRWQDTIPLSDPYQELDACAQPCVLQVNTNVSCWSYGCVCSENTVSGTNYQAGLKYIGSCAADRCPGGGGSAAVGDAQDTFMELCRVPFTDVSSSVVLTTATSTVDGTQTSIITVTTAVAPASTPSQGFKSKENHPIDSTCTVSDALIVDSPDDAYNALNPCLRFIFNACKSSKDNPPGKQVNCNATFPGDYSKIWNGLGAKLQCSDAECVCSATKFSYSLQAAFDEASILCDFTVPTQEKPSPDFELLGQMLTAFCSSEGFVLEEWLLDIIGYKKQKGLDTNGIISVCLGAASLVISVTSVLIGHFWEWIIGKCFGRKGDEKEEEDEEKEGDEKVQEKDGGVMETVIEAGNEKGIGNDVIEVVED